MWKAKAMLAQGASSDSIAVYGHSGRITNQPRSSSSFMIPCRIACKTSRYGSPHRVIKASNPFLASGSLWSVLSLRISGVRLVKSSCRRGRLFSAAALARFDALNLSRSSRRTQSLWLVRWLRRVVGMIVMRHRGIQMVSWTNTIVLVFYQLAKKHNRLRKANLIAVRVAKASKLFLWIEMIVTIASQSLTTLTITDTIVVDNKVSLYTMISA